MHWRIQLAVFVYLKIASFECLFLSSVLTSPILTTKIKSLQLPGSFSAIIPVEWCRKYLFINLQVWLSSLRFFGGRDFYIRSVQEIKCEFINISIASWHSTFILYINLEITFALICSKCYRIWLVNLVATIILERVTVLYLGMQTPGKGNDHFLMPVQF